MEKKARTINDIKNINLHENNNFKNTIENTIENTMYDNRYYGYGGHILNIKQNTIIHLYQHFYQHFYQHILSTPVSTLFLKFF